MDKPDFEGLLGLRGTLAKQAQPAQLALSALWVIVAIRELWAILAAQAPLDAMDSKVHVEIRAPQAPRV